MTKTPDPFVASVIGSHRGKMWMCLLMKARRESSGSIPHNHQPIDVTSDFRACRHKPVSLTMTSEAGLDSSPIN